MDILADLNPAQRAAVEMISGPVLILPALAEVGDRATLPYVSAACAGAAARLLGVIGQDALARAVGDELAALGPDVIEQNLARALQAFDAMAEAKQLLQRSNRIADSYIVVGRLSTTSVEQAREAVDMLKKKAKSAAIVLGFEDDGKATLLAGVTDDLVAKGLKAGDIVKEIAPIVDGGGGGRPQMAQAGGKNPKKIGDALSSLALEEERVAQFQVAIDEYDKLPQIIDDFVASIEEMGPNPFKGF